MLTAPRLGGCRAAQLGAELPGKEPVQPVKHTETSRSYRWEAQSQEMMLGRLPLLTSEISTILPQSANISSGVEAISCILVLNF